MSRWNRSRPFRALRRNGLRRKGRHLKQLLSKQMLPAWMSGVGKLFRLPGIAYLPVFSALRPIEPLERRVLLSAGPADFAYGYLALAGVAGRRLNVETVTLSANGQQFTVRDDSQVATYPTSQLELINVFGSSAKDYISIDPRIGVSETINESGSGADTIIAGGGSVSINGGNGNDLIYGGAGDDTIHNGTGNATIYAGSGADNISAYTGDDSIIGGTGNDTLNGGQGQSSITGGNANDMISNAANQPPVDTYIDEPLDAVISNWFSTKIFAGQTVQVNSSNSQIGVGDPLTAHFLWNFGDPNGQYNQLTGFNAAHVYNKPGNYTITLEVVNQNGQTAWASEKITVVADTRNTIYVATWGNDNNSGASTADPVQTLNRAVAMAGANTDILLERGETFNTTTGVVLQYDNQMIGAWGSGADPIIKYTGPRAEGNIITTVSPATGITIEDITFDSIYPPSVSETETGMFNAVYATSYNTSVLGCTFLNVGYAVDGAYWGMLVQNCNAPSQADLRGYFLWLSGTDIVALGNNVAGSYNQHDIRGIAIRVLLAFNTLANPPHGSITGKLCINLQGGSYFYIYGNTVANTGEGVWVGPLQIDGSQNAISWVVFDSNTLGGSFQLNPGAHHVLVVNNVMPRSGQSAFSIVGYDAGDAVRAPREVVDLRIEHNTVIEHQATSSFIYLVNQAQGIVVEDNLWIAPRLVYGYDQAAALKVAQNNLSSFSLIADNVWAAGAPDNVNANIYYVAPQPNDASAWESNARSEAINSNVVGNIVENIVLAPGVYDAWVDGTDVGKLP